MIGFEEIQTAYYLVAATGVLVAAFFYVLNLREATRNRRAILTNSLMQSFVSDEGRRRYVNLMSMEWKDFDDFKRKYDHRVNLENFIKRSYYWSNSEVLGYQYRSGLIDIETIYFVCGI